LVLQNGNQKRQKEEKRVNGRIGEWEETGMNGEKRNAKRTGLIMSGSCVEIMKGTFEKEEKRRWISGTGKSSLSEPAGSLQR